MHYLALVQNSRLRWVALSLVVGTVVLQTELVEARRSHGWRSHARRKLPGHPLVTRGNPLKLVPAGTDGSLVFGVFGSASSHIPAQVAARLDRLGQCIAARKGVVLTGACQGIPHAVVRAAKKAGGVTVGVSPAKNLNEHVGRFGSPRDSLDVIQMTGTGAGMGLIAREKQNIGYADILIFAGGRSGTIGEMMFGLQEPKVIALLEDSTGVTAAAKERILPYVGRSKAVIVSDTNPDRLITKAIAAKIELDAKLGASRGAAPSRSQRRSANKRLQRRLAGPLPPMTRRPLVTSRLARGRNIFAFIGSADGTTSADRRKVDRLAELVGGTKAGGREAVVVVPARRGLASRFARRASHAGAKTIGISHATSKRDHLLSQQAIGGLDAIQLTGQGPGIGALASYDQVVGRADVVFAAGGDHRTLGGAIFSMYQPTVLAVLETGGVSGKLRSEIMTTYNKKHPAKIIFDTDPERLYRRAINEAEKLRYQPKTPFVPKGG